MEDRLKYIAKVFIGDIEEVYAYKSGPKICEVFNKYFNYDEEYWSMEIKPSRWIIAYNKIVDLYNKNKINKFFSIILSNSYLYVENRDLNKQQLAEKASNILNLFNREFKLIGFEINNCNGEYKLTEQNADLEFLGAGGFAEVYKSKSRNIVVKKLKEEFYSDEGVVSRFKREFSIMKKLQDNDGILKVYDFDADELSYTMEPAELDLSKYIRDNNVNFEQKKKIILQILNIMKVVHNEDIWHRDISPSNILLVKGKLKISDFGLGKDMTVFNSHQTSYTRGMGQYFYCDPKQFMMLKEGNKASDIYSIGRLINFIMTKNPMDYEHEFKSVTEIATADSEMIRYKSVEEIENGINLIIQALEDVNFRENVLDKLKHFEYDESVWLFLDKMSMGDVFFGMKKNYFMKGYFDFIVTACSPEEGYTKLSLLYDECANSFNKSFEDYDPVAYFAIEVIKSKSADIVVKEAAVEILNFVIDCNRWNVWAATRNMVKKGIDKQLELKLNQKYLG